MKTAASAVPVSAFSEHGSGIGRSSQERIEKSGMLARTSRFPSSSFRVFLCVLCVFLLAPLTSYAQTTYPFDLPAQPLADSLRAVGHQTSTNVMFEPRLVRGLAAPALRAQTTTAEAVRLLLAGTKLTVLQTAEGTILIQHSTTAGKSESPRQAISPTSAASDISGYMRHAQAGQSSGSDGANQQTFEESSGNPGRRLELEEVIVTAQKRTERAFDVPMSILAISADELQKRKISSIDDLALVAPGLGITSDGPTRRIEIRGVSNVGGGNSSLIGSYLDEAVVTSGVYSQLDVDIYDLERIEVLRGPQGTLYGEGSAGGTIRFITKNPVLDKLTFDSDLVATVTEDGAPGARIEGVLNVPLVDDKLALRIAGTFDHGGGWVDQPAADKKDINDQNRTSVRVKGLWQPVPQLAINAMAVVHRNDAPINQGEDSLGNFRQVFGLTTSPSVQDDYDLYNLTLTYDFPSVQILSTTSYVQQDQEQKNNGWILPLAAPPFEILQSPALIDADALTQEFRLTSIGAEYWQWTVGAFYRDFRYNVNVQNFCDCGVPVTPGTLPIPFAYQADFLTKSKSVFGDANYKLTDRFTLGAGVRYFEDDQQFTSGSFQSGTFDSSDPRVYASYKATDRINIYASAAKGFRSGGFNSLNQPSFGPEDVKTYELGAKASLLDGRLSANAAVFYSDYTDYQITGILPPPEVPIAIIRNAGSARIKGVEWDWTVRPADQWTLAFSGAYMDTRFYEIDVIGGAYAVGDPIDFVPTHTFTISAERDFSWYSKPGFARLDYNQKGRETFRQRSTGIYNRSEVIDMLNFSMNLQWSADLSLGLFAQNLLNDRDYLNPFSIEGLAPRARPRTFGIEFAVTFD